jgi:hypothetical protein
MLNMILQPLLGGPHEAPASGSYVLIALCNPELLNHLHACYGAVTRHCIFTSVAIFTSRGITVSIAVRLRRGADKSLAFPICNTKMLKMLEQRSHKRVELKGNM